MKRQTFLKVVLCGLLLVGIMLPAQAKAQPPRSRGRGLYGDWMVKIDYEGRQYDSIISFSRNKEGKRTAHWISIMGMTELQDVSYEDGKLNFMMERRSRDGEVRTSKFAGTIEKGKLTGALTSDRGEYKVAGGRVPRMPRAVGNWQMNFRIGDRDITTTLLVKADKENKLAAEWQSRWGKHTITDVKYDRGKFSFKRKSTFNDRQIDSTFEGTIDRETDTLSGTIKSEMGEVRAVGKRVGAALIGDWSLEVASNRGPRTHRLRVYPDMSGLFATIPVKKITFEDNRVDFLAVLQFGDQSYELTFEGKLEESKLTGELTSSQGTQKINGTKIIRTFRRRRSQ